MKTRTRPVVSRTRQQYSWGYSAYMRTVEIACGAAVSPSRMLPLFVSLDSAYLVMGYSSTAVRQRRSEMSTMV